jgi:DNA repair exonuclease SbcCD ATPase subunit
MRVLKLETENVKRIKAATITPDGNMVIIGGSNGQGKSSLIDSIFYLFGGEKALPPKPVRDGAAEATITADIGEFIVTKRIPAEGRATLTVRGRDGGKHMGPQTILDSIYGKLSFDPLEFSRQDPKKQLDTLKVLVNLDFTTLERVKEAKKEDRTMIGREVAQLKGQLAGLPHHADAPTEEVSIVELTRELNQARVHNQKIAEEKRQLANREDIAGKWAQEISNIEKDIARLQQELNDARATHALATQQHKEQLARVAATKEKNEQTILERMAGAEMLNRKAQENRRRLQIAQQLEQKEAAWNSLSDEIAGIDAEKVRQLQSVKFPVEGLSFDENAVLVNGQPFQQASAAEQLRISVAMGCALNPKLKVMLVRDGSLLDATSMRLLTELAAKHDTQIWLERVGKADEAAIVIEDGCVAAKSASK